MAMPSHPSLTRRRDLATPGYLPVGFHEGQPQSFDRDVVEERRELHVLVSSCDLAHAFQRTVHASPALRPVRVLLVGVLLDQTPSLHHLRGRGSSLVRQLRRYLGSV